MLDVAGDLDVSLKCVRQGGLVSLIGFLDEKSGEAEGKGSVVPGILFGGKTGAYPLPFFFFSVSALSFPV